MAHLPPILNPTEDDIQKMLACNVHIGTRTCETTMQTYVWGRRADGVYIINLQKTWEKLVLAALVIAGIENPQDVVVVSARAFGQRAVLKLAKYTKAQAIAGRYTPGTFTNQVTKKFIEPRLLIATDPRTDSQAVRESSYCNMPVIALCHTDSPLRYVDIAIPCNNKARTATGLMYWMLTREVLRLRNVISRKVPWDVMPDLYFYRDPDEQEKQEEEEDQWGDSPAAPVAAPGAAAAAPTPATAAAAAAAQPAIEFPTIHTGDWGAEVPAGAAAVPAAASAARTTTWDSTMPQAMSSSWETAPK